MTNSYESPFCTRYASKEMQFIFSADKKFTTWRKLWVALARAEMKLGLNVTQEQVDELEANIDNIDYALPLSVKSLFVMTLCHTFMLMALFVQRQQVSFTLAQLHAM